MPSKTELREKASLGLSLRSNCLLTFLDRMDSMASQTNRQRKPFNVIGVFIDVNRYSLEEKKEANVTEHLPSLSLDLCLSQRDVSLVK